MINVQYLQLPSRIKALSTVNEDCSYTIILNSCLNYEQNRKSLFHEISHIENDDFYKDNVDEIEITVRERRL